MVFSGLAFEQSILTSEENFCEEKLKLSKLGTENAEIWIKTILIFEISTLDFVEFENVLKKNKKDFMTKNTLIAHFGAGNFKYYCHILN